MQQPATSQTSDDFLACKAVAGSSLFCLIMSICGILLCWTCFFVAPITLGAGVLSCAAVTVFGVGSHSSPNHTFLALENLRKAEGCCCGGPSSRHARNLFLAAAVFSGMAFVANAVTAAVWVPCDRYWGDYYYYDDYYYYGFYDYYGHSWEKEPCENFNFYTLTEFLPAILADSNPDGHEYSKEVCNDHVDEPDLRTALHSLWLEENPSIAEKGEDFECEEMPSSWEATNHFKSFGAYDDWASDFQSLTKCQRDVEHLYLVKTVPSCHGDGDECSDSFDKSEECSSEFQKLPPNEDNDAQTGTEPKYSARYNCFGASYEEHSDIVGCFVECWFFPVDDDCDDTSSCYDTTFVPHADDLDAAGLLKVYNRSGLDFAITVTKTEEEWYDEGRPVDLYGYRSRRNQCERPTREGVFAYGCVVSAVVYLILLIVNSVNTHRMGKIGFKSNVIQSVEMTNMSMTADNEVVFHAAGHSGWQQPSGLLTVSNGNGLLQSNATPVSQEQLRRPTLDVAMMPPGLGQTQQQQMYQQQLILQRLDSQSQQIEQQRLQIQRFEYEQRLADASQARTAVAFNLDGTIASLPEATAILQDAQYK